VTWGVPDLRGSDSKGWVESRNSFDWRHITTVGTSREEGLSTRQISDADEIYDQQPKSNRPVYLSSTAQSKQAHPSRDALAP